MKTAMLTTATTLAAVLLAGCSDTSVTRETTGYGANAAERRADADSQVITRRTTQERTYLDPAPTRSDSTTTIDRPDGSKSTVEERTYTAPDGTTTQKRTTTTTVD